MFTFTISNTTVTCNMHIFFTVYKSTGKIRRRATTNRFSRWRIVNVRLSTGVQKYF